jgi:exosortase A-associated hydrolase 2
MRIETGYIAGPNGGLYAGWHAPVGEARRALLVAGPFGEERKCAYRLLVWLAEQLAAAGCGVLRVDVSGTGESAGEHAAASIATWRADLAAAHGALATLAPGLPIGLLGVRLGANLLAGLDTPADRLVAWAPLLAGEELLEDLIRRKQIKEMLGGGQAASDAASLDAAWAAGETVDVDAFAVGPQLARQLRGLELLADLEAAAARGTRALVLPVSGATTLKGPWPAAAERIATLGGRVEPVREKPFWGRMDVVASEPLWGVTRQFLDLSLPGEV